MKLLLTSGGITNKSIAKSLRKLLGKPFKKSGVAKALPKFLKTKVYAGISAGSIVAAPNLTLSVKAVIYLSCIKKKVNQKTSLLREVLVW